MKIALAQISPKLGDVPFNLNLHLDAVRRAEKDGADLLVFPELSLTGYTLKDMVKEVAIQKDSPAMEILKEASRKVSLVFGFVEEKSRGLFFNSAAYLEEGQIVSIHRKVYLPNYGMFEEAKFFTSGKEFKAFDTKLGRVGMQICYDFLHLSTSYVLHADEADLMITLSAAPGRGVQGDKGYDSSRMWELMGESVSRFTTTFVVYCNRSGQEDGKMFAGGSFIYDPEGKREIQAPYMEDAFLVKEIDLEKINRVRITRPYRRDDRPDIILRSLHAVVSRHEN